jgi:hypothetical protein
MIHIALVSDTKENQEVSGHPRAVLQAHTARGATKYSMDGLVPGWWCQNFNPYWKPLVQWLRRQQNMTLSEFQLITSRMTELTAIEKAIIISAFIAYKNVQPPLGITIV